MIDHVPYSEKTCSAVFVGATTGGIVTESVIENLSMPRLRSAVFFKNDPDVVFRLPHLVQYDSKITENRLRAMGFGGNRVSWQEQFTHKFLISMDGNGATCSRVIISLRSNSILLKYDSQHVLFYFSGLTPWLHYIPISLDSDVNRMVDIEKRYPGIFDFIARSGKIFYDNFLTRYRIFQYTAWLLHAYSESFARLPDERGADSGFPDVRPPVATNQNAILEIMVHVQSTGNKRYDPDSWIGEPGSHMWIEGFAVELTPGLRPSDIQYQVVHKDGTISEVANSGEFCGTHGMGVPILGFRFLPRPPILDPLEWSYFGRFTDGSTVGPIPVGEICKSTTGAPLEAFQFVFVADGTAGVDRRQESLATKRTARAEFLA